MVGAKRPRRGGKPDKVRKCRNPTPYVTFELLKQPCEKASKLGVLRNSLSGVSWCVARGIAFHPRRCLPISVSEVGAAAEAAG